MNTASQLRAERRRAGLSQSQAAEVCDVPLRSYQGWEAGRGERSVGPRDALDTLKRQPKRRAAQHRRVGDAQKKAANGGTGAAFNSTGWWRIVEESSVRVLLIKHKLLDPPAA